MRRSKLVGLIVGAVALAAAFLASAGSASASVMVSVTGDFVNYGFPPSYYAELNAGSFSASFTLPGFPGSDATVDFSSFTVDLYDASHTLVYTFSSSAGDTGYISSDYAYLYGGDIVDFYGPNSAYFQLVFPTSFAGTGPVISSGSGSFSYTYLGNGQYGYIADATATVPEAPAVLDLAAGLAILAAFGVVRRRRGGERLA